MDQSPPCYPSRPLPPILPPSDNQLHPLDVNVQSSPTTNSMPEMALGYQIAPSSRISCGNHATQNNFQYNAHYQLPYSSAYGSAYETPHETPYETPYKTSYDTSCETSHNTSCETSHDTSYGLSQSQAYLPSNYMPISSFQSRPSTAPSPASANAVTPIPSPSEKRKRGKKAKAKPTEVPVSQPSGADRVAETNAEADYHRYWSMHMNEHGQSAYSILVQWVIVPGNYNRWRAKESKKREIADEISVFLIKRGITGRTPDSCYCQVREVEKKYRWALEETKKTGGGLIGYSGEKPYNEKIEEICPHFYELDAVMADRPSSTPLDNIESMADLDEAASMEALRLPVKKSITIDVDVDDKIIPNETADTDDDGFAIPPPLNRNALMQAIDGADKAVNLRPNKCPRVLSASQDESSDSVPSQLSIKKARNPNAGRFLSAIGINSSPSSHSTSRKGASQTSSHDLIKFQEKASKQRDDLIEIQKDAVKVQADAGKDMGTAMKSMADTLKAIITPDQTEAQMKKMQLKHMIKLQEAELMDKALERKSKLIERLALTGMTSTEANALADQMIREAEKNIANMRNSSPGKE